MPTYDYRCPVCGATKEVVHAMAECQAPSESTLLEITCTCDGQAAPPITGVLMERYLGGAPAVGKIAGMTPHGLIDLCRPRGIPHDLSRPLA